LTFFDGVHEQDILAIQNNLFRNGIEARSTKDIFLGMTDGITHYNGTDIQYLYEFSNSSIHVTSIKAFSSEVFVLTQDLSTNVSLIYRGYLK
jgi:hypothetical protein